MLELLERLRSGVLPEDVVLILQMLDTLHELPNPLLEDVHLLTDGEHQVGLDQVLGERGGRRWVSGGVSGGLV